MGRSNAKVPSGLLVAVLVPACGDPAPALPPGAVVLNSAQPVCAGTLPVVAFEARRVEAELGLDWVYPIAVEIADPEDVEAVCPTSCGDQACSGCTVGAYGNVRVHANLGAVSHELVHALRRQHGIDGIPFVEEGVATALSGGPLVSFGVGVTPDDWAMGPRALFDLTSSELVAAPAGYLIAAHFYGFVAELAGEAHVLEAVSNASYRDAVDTADFRAWFRGAFALSVDEADAAWRAQGYGEYSRGSGCTPETTLRLRVGSSASLAQTRDCEGSTDTVGPFWGGSGPDYVSLQRWCLETQAGQLAVAGHGDGVSLTLSPLDCSGPDPKDVASIAVRADEGFAGPIDACTWLILASGDADVFSYEVQFRLD